MVRAKPRTEIILSLSFVCALACGLGLGCSSGSSANIGDGEVAVDKSAISSYAAEWTGYVEAHTFTSGSDRVRVTLDEQGNGWLQIGEGAQLPAPTDPNVGWPASFTGLDPKSVEPRAATVMDGVRYPITGARVAEERLRFTINPYDAFKTWCELQTPLLHTNEIPPRYGCTSVSGYGYGNGQCSLGSTENGDPIPVDCAKAVLCACSVCECNATSCTAGVGQTIAVDAALDDDGQGLVGSILLPAEVEGARIIRLER